MESILTISHVTAWRDHLITELLEGSGYVVERVCTQRGDPLPSSAAAYAGIVSGGGFEPVSSREQFSWMLAEIALIEDALKSDTPFLGLCLGAQLLAAALGEIAATSPDAIEERGYCEIDTHHPCLDGITHVFQWHFEGIALPPGAELLASSRHFEVQAFRVGSAVGLQFHPDVRPERIGPWTAADPLCHQPGTDFARKQSALGQRHDPAIRQWLERFLPWWLSGGGAN